MVSWPRGSLPMAQLGRDPDEKLPHNLEAETQLVGAILVNNEAAARVTSFLLPEHFFEVILGKIYALAIKLIERGEHATPVTLYPYLNSDLSFAKAGGTKFLARLAAEAATIVHVLDHGRQIFELAQRRQFIRIGLEIAESGFDTSGEVSLGAQVADADTCLIELLRLTSPSFKTLLWREIEPDLNRKQLVSGILDHGEFSVWYGEPASGKSFLALDLASHVAIGYDWRGHHVERGGVVYVGAEGGIGLKKRIRALRLHYGLDRTADVPFALLPQAIDLIQPEGLATLMNEIRRLETSFSEGVKLVVIDTLARCLSGDENSSVDMNHFIQAIDRIRETFGAHVLIVHHSGKTQSLGPRGHSALLAAADVCVRVEKSEGGAARVATIIKCKDGETGTEMPFELCVVDIGIDAYGHTVTSCAVVHVHDFERREKQARPAPSLIKGLELLRKAISEVGELSPPSASVPEDKKAVLVETFKSYCDVGGLCKSDKRANRKRVFNRTIAELQTRGSIEVREGWVWIVE